MMQHSHCKRITFLLLLVGLMGAGSSVYGQGRSYIKSVIQRWGDCRNVAITKTNGDLALHQRNAYVSSGIPKGMSDALDKLNDEGELIDDVVLTEDGRYLILYGNNGVIWNDIPYSLERKLREFNDENEVILSVTFNDAGDWVVITTNYYSASDASIQRWLKEGNEEYGMLWSVCITDDACVAVYQTGYRSLGNIPSTLASALRNTNIDVYRLKIAGSSWFFADLDGHFRYNM